jgi:putative ABC transport system permease protein
MQPCWALLGDGHLWEHYDSGEILGIDRYNLPNIMFWRYDFADQPLGALMNELGKTFDGILVPESFMSEHLLSYGDLITLRIVNYQEAKEVDFHVVGSFKLFPTYYPGDRPVFVANLDYIFEGVGGEYPYNVWLKTNTKEIDLQAMSSEATQTLGARTLSWKETQSLINEEQTRPERQGLFGVLSVGFGAAALLTVLGFLLYALLSYQRRFVELGVLRAIGLSTNQMTIFLASELALLISMGALIGTALGVWVSNMFIPYLQVGASQESQIPPYVVFIAWPAISKVYILFGLLFVVALATLVVLLRRMKIFQAIKMGETV